MRAGGTAAPVLPFLPASFAECGVNVPFTTPQLVGTRVRASPGGLEGVVPSPSGRGIYVLPWKLVGSLCRPTVFDLRLVGRIGSLTSIRPATIRATSRAVAAEGLAGRMAMHAAQAAIEAAARATRHAHAHLHTRLAREIGPGGEAPARSRPGASSGGPAGVEQTVAAFALRNSLPPDDVARALREIAVHVAALGLGCHHEEAFLPAKVARLGVLRNAFCQGADAGGALPHDLAPVVALLDLLLVQVAAALQDIAGLTEDVSSLVRNWQKSAVSFRTAVSEPEWLLDGWDRLDALWRLEADGQRPPMKLAQIAALLPPLPSNEPRAAGAFRLRHIILHGRRQTRGRTHDNRSEPALDEIANNETVLGLVA